MCALSYITNSSSSSSSSFTHTQREGDTKMGNSLRCCLACIFPCGALDLIRIVHVSGQVEEYGRPVFAKEILDANPDHVMSKPCSEGASHRITIVSPNVELKRGGIYFLVPASALPETKKKMQRRKSRKTSNASTKALDGECRNLEISLEEKRRRHRQFKRDRGATWRPHLESIFED